LHQSPQVIQISRQAVHAIAQADIIKLLGMAGKKKFNRGYNKTCAAEWADTSLNRKSKTRSNLPDSA